MKLKLTILLFVLSISINAQNKLNGTYLLGTGYEGWDITFKKNSEFEYFFSSCTGGEEGSGTYVLTSDSLFLLFQSNPKTRSKKEMFIDSIYSCNKRDSVKINITINDDIEPIVFAPIKIGNNGRTSDIDGKAEITLAKDTNLIQVDVSYVGYESVRFWIRPTDCRNLKIHMDGGFIKSIKEGTIYDYKIRIKSKNHIVLKKYDYEMDFYKKKIK